jgi:flagellar basal body rod protein FlgB
MIGEKDLAVPSKLMDFYALRQKLAAHNVANAGVAGFHKLDAQFEAELQQAIEKGDVEAVRKAPLHVQKAKGTGVDTDTEVAQMAKNEVLFNTFAEIASYHLRMLRTAATSK